MLILLICLVLNINPALQTEECVEGNVCSQNRSQPLEAHDDGIRIIEDAAEILKRRFQEISLGEMGLQDILDSGTLDTSQQLSRHEILSAMVKKLVHKVEAVSNVLLEMKRTLRNVTNAESFLHPCPSLENIHINNQKVMLNIPKSSCGSCAQHLVHQYNLKLERQGYLSVADRGVVRGCRESSTGGGRRLLHRSMQSETKAVVILLDCGSHMDPDGLERLTAIARDLLELLEPQDLVAVVHTDHRPRTLPLGAQGMDNCTTDGVAPFQYLTETTKDTILRYLSSVEVGEEPSNVTAALREVLQMVSEHKHPGHGEVLVVYLGRQSSIAKHRGTPQLQEAIQHLSNIPQVRVVLSGCSVPDTLEYISTLITFNKVNIHTDHTLAECSAHSFLCSDWLINLNTSQSSGEVASRLLLQLPLHPLESHEMAAAPPHWEPKPDPWGLAPFLLPFYVPLSRVGVLFVNMYLSDLAEDVIYFNSYSNKLRAFLIDLSGNVIAHSSYPRPELVTKPRVIHITTLEDDDSFQGVKPLLFSKEFGEEEINKNVYTWRRVRELFVLCIVAAREHVAGGAERQPSEPPAIPQELQHHRMDLLPPANSPLCRHFLTVSTIHRGTLYLSPSSFVSPFTYLYELYNTKELSLTFVHNYMAYIKDDTGLLSNPGLRAGVRDHVGRLNRLLAFFKDRHIRGVYNKYIVRRYAASGHGVLVLFPGTILESDFEPNRKSWFLRALRNPGKVILTPPYLDIGGAGYIVTISQAPPGTGVVVSIDITMRYLYKMLQEVFPSCTYTDIRCFLMDDRGYLLSHPGLVDPSNFGPVEQTHITHKESHIVNDMFNHKGFVTKELCQNLADSTLQRYYHFNMSSGRTLTNFVSGDHYARYHISPVSGTNIFVGIINASSAAGQSVFCPCSVENRLCLNCNRMEQDECECPCECHLPAQECSAEDQSRGRQPPLCGFESERNHRNNFYTRRYNLAPHLDSCFDFQCESYATKQSCLGVLGCEWCEVERDRETLLPSPFCTAQPHCFGGVLSGPTPYELGFFGQMTQDEISPPYSAVGPIVGCVVALCLILALAVYCYRQNLPSTQSEEPFSTPQDTWPHVPVQITHLAPDEDILDERSGHQEQLLLAAEAPVSPYRILTGYRRPPTAGESDHGYSTMTPHDDSEHQAFTPLAEPPSSPSLSTPRSSATDLPLSVLPSGNNHILAPVTVHRHMEAS